MNEQIKKLLENNPRLYDYYAVGPVQRASIEDFIHTIITAVAAEIHSADVGELQGKSYYLDRVAEHIEKHFGIVAVWNTK